MSEEKRSLMSGAPISYRSLASDEDSGKSEHHSAPYDLDTSSVSVRGLEHSINSISHHDSDNEGNSFDGFSGQSTISETLYTVDETSQFMGLDPNAILQAVVFIEDGYDYRSISHRVDPTHLKVYRQHKSTGFNVLIWFTIFVLHFLAFFEYPSSISITSDLRYRGDQVEVPCWLTQTIELLCLLVLLLDGIMKIYDMSVYYFVRHKWDLMALIFVLISLIDWVVSFTFGCQEYIRFRRILRPFFIMQHSSLMKKIVNCLRRTVPEVASVLLLLFLHLFIFTMFGMLIFPDAVNDDSPGNGTTVLLSEDVYGHQRHTAPDLKSSSSKYFTNFLDSLIRLLVLLTTANNPDATLPAYSKNRFASLFFVLYLLIGLYCFMNMLLAVIYNQFRGYFLDSMQRDLRRRRVGVRASFEVLRRKNEMMTDGSITPDSLIGLGVGGHVVKAVVDKSILPKHVKDTIIQGLQGQLNRMLTLQQYQQLFYSMDKEIVRKERPSISWCVGAKWRKVQRAIVHRYFTYFGILMCLANLIIIAASLASKNDEDFEGHHAFLQMVNFSFIVYYLLEQIAKIWAYGWRRYLWERGNIIDAVVTIALIIGEVYLTSIYGLPYMQDSAFQNHQNYTLWNVIRVVNIFIMFRMVKVIPHIKAMSLVVSVLVDLIKNMKAFGGVLVVIYYAFGIMGMELFHDKIQYKPEYKNMTFECGTYEQLNYWANNFDDFFSSIVVLWDVMVVNNWQVFLYVFRDKTSPWSYLFFIVWWIVGVIIIMNLFTALIMENFIMKWDRRSQLTSQPISTPSPSEEHYINVNVNNDVHAMFRDLLEEPTDNELLIVLNKHYYLQLDR